MKVIKLNHPVDMSLNLEATDRAIHRTMAPRLMGDTAVMQEINNVIIILLIIINIIERSYNKRLFLLQASKACVQYTLYYNDPHQ